MFISIFTSEIGSLAGLGSVLAVGSAEDVSPAGLGSSFAIGSDATFSITTCLADGSTVTGSGSAFSYK